MKPVRSISSPDSVDAYCFDGDQLVNMVGSYADQDADLEPGGTVSFTIDLSGEKCDTFAVGGSGWFS